MDAACRSSFQSSHESTSSFECPPSKIRRTCLRSSDGSNCETLSVHSEYEDETYLAISPLGFGFNDFLPLNSAQQLKQAREKRLSTKPLDINQLSDDILGKCLFNGFLDTFETARLMTVNKRFRKIGLNQVQHLDLRTCQNLTTADVATIATSFQNLLDLNFSYCSTFGGDELIKIVPASKSLKHLTLSGTSVDDTALTKYLQQVHDRFGICKLESLDLSAISQEGRFLVGDAGAKAISTHCPNLKVLRLGWCKNFTDQGMQCLASLKDLTELDVSLTSISSKSRHDLLEIMGPRLKVLDLSATDIFKIEEENEDEDLCISFDSLQQLSSLKLCFCKDLTPSLFECLLKGSKALKKVDVTHSGPGGRLIVPSSLEDLRCRRKLSITGAWISKP